MANTIKQIVVQDNVIGLNKRFIIQYHDDNGNEQQKLCNYDDCTAQEKADYDTFFAASVTIMNS